MRRWRAVFGHKIDSVSRYGIQHGSALAIGWQSPIHTDQLAPLYYSSYPSPTPLFLTAFLPFTTKQRSRFLSCFCHFQHSILPSCLPACVDLTVDYNPAVSEIHLFFPFVSYSPPSHCHDRFLPLWISIPPFKKTCRHIPKVPLPLFFSFVPFRTTTRTILR